MLQQYERVSLCDQHGRLVPTSSNSAGKPAFSLAKLAELLRDEDDFDTCREYRPGVADAQLLLAGRAKLRRRDARLLGTGESCTFADVMTTTHIRWSSPEHPEGCPVPLVGIRYPCPGLEPCMKRVYPTSKPRHSREDDYAIAWKAFASLTP
jgi:hypothetical protein